MVPLRIERPCKIDCGIEWRRQRPGGEEMSENNSCTNIMICVIFDVSTKTKVFVEVFFLQRA